MPRRKDRVVTALLIAVSAAGVLGIGDAYAADNGPQEGSKEWCDGMLKIYNSYLDTAGEEAKHDHAATADLFRSMAGHILDKARAAGCEWVKYTREPVPGGIVVAPGGVLQPLAATTPAAPLPGPVR